MAGRHRKPPAWRQLLRSLLRTRSGVRAAALRTEIAQLRAVVARLETELAAARDAALLAAESSAFSAGERRGPLVVEAPLVALALSGVVVDRRPDTALTEIVLPERALLDPRVDRPDDVVDLSGGSTGRAAAPRDSARRTA